MEKLKHINKCLINCVECELDKGLQQVNTQELGEVIDMIKDLEDAMYHHKIVEAMEIEADEKPKTYSLKHQEKNSLYYHQKYMESKENHLDKAEQIKEFNGYINELSNEIDKIIEHASVEEKQMLLQKMTAITNKIK
jgi:hypothetical protein